MGFSKWVYDKLRNYRHVRWYYNTYAQNVEYGKNAAAHVLAHARVSESNANAPIEQTGAVDAKLENVVLPAELEEIRQAYENKGVDFVEKFRRGTSKIFKDLDVCSEMGQANIGLLRNDLFSYLKTYSFIQQYKALVWILFIFGLIGLSMLDLAPSLLVFEALMENDNVSIGALIGVDDSVMRNLLLSASTLSFLIVIVLMGHVVAKLVAATYLDGEIPWVGIAIGALVLAVFFTVAWIRYNHESKTTYESYSGYVKKFERDKLTGTALADKPLTMEEWQPGNQVRALFNSAIFVQISVMIFVVAIYLSLWRLYGDLRMITRRFKHIRYRVRCAKLSASLRSENNSLVNSWERLRQSAQIELEQFLAGITQAVRQSPEMFEGLEWPMQQVIFAMRKQFSECLQLPQVYDKTASVLLPGSEEGWGMRYEVFMTEVIWYEAFSKGANDAINHGLENPDSVVHAISSHSESAALLEDVNPETLKKNYEAGFREGKHIPHGAAWKNANAKMPVTAISATTGAADNNSQAGE